MKWTDELTIETPEQIGLDLELAGLGSRLVARLIDWLIKGCAIVVVFLVGLVVLTLLGTSFGDRSLGMGLAAVLIAATAVFIFGYDIYYEVHHNGQTPGKKFANIRVLREGGNSVDFSASCVRNLLALADMLPFFYLIGAFLVLLTNRNQRLGDMAAGTIVVRERVFDNATTPAVDVSRFASDQFSFTAEQLRRVTAEDRVLIRSFFERCYEMERRARERIAAQLADGLMRRLEFPPVPELDLIAFLASLHRDAESHNERLRDFRGGPLHDRGV